MKKKEVTIYFVGGCGLNLAEHTEASQLGEFTGFAKPNIVYYDSSNSNLPEKNPGKVSIRHETDGFGKSRAEAFAVLKSGAAQNLLKENPPAELSVVVFSLSGGTGSVMGPLIIDSLLQMGKPVVAIGILAAECERTTKNTIDTIKTLAAISKKNNKPVVMSFHDNFGPGSTLESVNLNVSQEIRALLLLGSGQNLGLDSTDIAKFLQYNFNATNHPAGLVDLLINFGNSVEVDTAITTISLLKSQASEQLRIARAASAVGYLPDGCVESTTNPLPDTHYLITPELMQTRMGNLNETLLTLADAQTRLSQTVYDFGEDEDFVV
jgi:hypothetical protein